MKFLKFYFLLIIIFLILFPKPVFAADPVLHVTGPNDEPDTQLPSAQSNNDWSIHIQVENLDTNKNYCLTFNNPLETDPSKPSAQFAKGSLEEEASSFDGKGNLEYWFSKDSLPKGPYTGNFFVVVYEKTTASCSLLTNDVVRLSDGTALARPVTIVQTATDYKKIGGGDEQPLQANPDQGAGKTSIGNFVIDDIDKFAGQFVRVGIGIGGGIAFLLMVFGAYRLIFAGGNPEAVQQGREIITAAVMGLIVIIFSVFILKLIGISILGIPGF